MISISILAAAAYIVLRNNKGGNPPTGNCGKVLMRE